MKGTWLIPGHHNRVRLLFRLLPPFFYASYFM